MELSLNLKKMLSCCSRPFGDFRLAEFQYNPSDAIKIIDQEPKPLSTMSISQELFKFSTVCKMCDVFICFKRSKYEA